MLLKMDGLTVNWSQQIFWTLAVVATLLLIILLIYNLFNEEAEHKDAPQTSNVFAIDARTVLLFFATFGWVAVISFYFENVFAERMIYAALIGLAVAFLPNISQKFLKKYLTGNAKTILASTGKVMQSIPPHRAGSGKVHLQMRRIPVEVNAVTQGEELPVGAPIRVIGMVDDHTILVESLEENGKTTRSEDEEGKQNINRPPTAPI